MAFSMFINFNGNCREAVEFYAKAFGRDLPKFLTYTDAPPDAGMDLPAGAENLVMYTGINIGGAEVMFCDVPPGTELVHGNNLSPVVSYTDKADVQRVFDNLKAGGRVDMALQETFWSGLYGMVTDRFGVTWQIDLDDGRQMDW